MKAKSGSKSVTNPEVKPEVKSGAKAETKAEAKGGVLAQIGSMSDEVLSLGASLAMGVLLLAPAVMAVMASIKRSIDFTMYIYMSMIKDLVFPLACSIVFVIYIIFIIRMQSNGANLKAILFRNPAFTLFLLTTIYILCSQFYNGAQYALTGFCAASLGETFGMEICYFIFILFGATQIKVESHKKFLLRMHQIISVILVIAAFILWKTQVDSSFFSDWTPRFSSIFSNTNYYGYYLAVSVPVAGAAFIYEKKLTWKIISAVTFILNSVALSLNDTMGAWVGAGFAVLFIVVAHLIIEKKVNFEALALIPVFVLCLYIPGQINGNFEENFSSLTGDIAKVIEGGEAAESAGSSRWKIWKASLDIANDNKIFGVGFEGIKYKGYVGAPYNIRPHNEFIQYAMFHGYPAAIFYFAGCLVIFIRALRRRKEMNGATLVALCGAFGYLVSSFFGLTLFSTGYFLFIFLGMGYVNENSGQELKEGGLSQSQIADFRKSNIYLGITIAAAICVFVTLCGLVGLAKSPDTSDTSGSQSQTGKEAQKSPYDGLPLVSDGRSSFYMDGDHAIFADFNYGDEMVEELYIDQLIELEGTRYPVTAIGNGALQGHTELTRIVLPSTIKTIGDNAFDGCENVVEIVLPEGLEQIGNEAFSCCSSLEKITLPSTVKTIGEESFFSCDGMKEAELSANLMAIPRGAFMNCSVLEKVNIPKGVTVIGANAFDACEALQGIELPEGLLTIEDEAFYDCSAIETLKLPASLGKIGDTVFDNCDSLDTVYVPSDKASYYKELFKDYEFKVKGY